MTNYRRNSSRAGKKGGMHVRDAEWNDSPHRKRNEKNRDLNSRR